MLPPRRFATKHSLFINREHGCIFEQSFWCLFILHILICRAAYEYLRTIFVLRPEHFLVFVHIAFIMMMCFVRIFAECLCTQTRTWETENVSQFLDKGYQKRENIRPPVFGSHLYFPRGSVSKQSVYAAEYPQHEIVSKVESFRPKQSVFMVDKDNRTFETANEIGLPS